MNKIGLIFVLLFFFCAFVSCHDEDDRLIEGYVISHSMNLCMCCPGYVIAVGADTIKTESGVVWDLIGDNDEYPIPVYVELGEKDEVCSKYFSNIDSYEVECIKLREEN